MSEFSVQDELKILFQIAAPIIGMTVFTKLLFLESFSLIGAFLDSTSISAVSLAIDITNLTGCSFLYGTLTGIETLGPQALGAKRFRRFGIIFKQAIVTLLLVFIPVSLLWIFGARSILQFLQEPEEPSLLASSVTGNTCRFKGETPYPTRDVDKL